MKFICVQVPRHLPYSSLFTLHYSLFTLYAGMAERAACGEARTPVFLLSNTSEASLAGRRATLKKISLPKFLYAGMAELADAQDLGSCVNSCRFDPCYPHQTRADSILESALVSIYGNTGKEPNELFAFSSNHKILSVSV